jgi:hypothetical protein
MEEISFEIRGDIPFGEYHDGMRNSRLAKHINLFQNCQFFILCNGCQEQMVSEINQSVIRIYLGKCMQSYEENPPRPGVEYLKPKCSS